MSWGTRTIRGTPYPLAHLNTFVLPVAGNTKGYRVQVAFGAHCFTRDVIQADTPDLIFMDGGKQRTFCVNRYAHSLHLPAAICQAASGEVCLSGNNFVIGTTLPGLVGPYLIAFTLRRAGGKKVDLKMDVRSAHHRPNYAANLPTAKFGVVVACAVNQTPIRWTKK